MTGGVGRTLAQAAFELRLLLRNAEQLLVTLVIPVGLLVFFSLVDVLPTAGLRPVDFLLPGVLALAVVAAAMVSLGIATGFERSALVLKRLAVTPLRRAELVVAKIVATLAVLAIQVAVIVGAGLALGWRPGPGAWVGVPLLLGGTAAFGGIGLAVAGRLPALLTLAVLNALFVGLLLVSGLVFPLDALPDGFAAVARFLPSAALAAALRAVAAGGAPPAAEVVVLAAWAVVTPLLAARLFRWE